MIYRAPPPCNSSLFPARGDSSLEEVEDFCFCGCFLVVNFLLQEEEEGFHLRGSDNALFLSLEIEVVVHI